MKTVAEKTKAKEFNLKPFNLINFRRMRNVRSWRVVVLSDDERCKVLLPQVLSKSGSFMLTGCVCHGDDGGKSSYSHPNTMTPGEKKLNGEMNPCRQILKVKAELCVDLTWSPALKHSRTVCGSQKYHVTELPHAVVASEKGSVANRQF